MKLYDCIQGTPEWTHLRAGIPTASQFDRIVTPKGKISTQAEKYMYELLAERMMGHPVTEYMSRWMDRGSQTEAEAVAFYSFTRDQETVKVGFITNDEGTIGASPDRLVGEKGLLEIKVPKEAVHVSYMMQSGGAYDEYKVQTQGQLWIAERDWNDLLSYHPELPEAIIRIERDEPFIQILSTAVETFSLELERQYQLCVERGWVSQPKPQPEMSASDAMKDILRELKREAVTKI
jgi:hypothetical protein